MGETTKILWSGLTGRVGREAMRASRGMSGVDIVMGMSRFDMSEVLSVNGEKFEGVKWLNYDMSILWGDGLLEAAKKANIDVIVDFSHPDVFEKIVELAVRANVPLISGTSGLTDRQMAMLYGATCHIPVFRGGNFRFKIKKFIDDCIEVAKREEGTFYLCANSSPDVSLRECSETSNVIHRRMVRVSDNYAGSGPQDYFPEGDNTVDWEFHIQKNPFRSVVGASCHVVGYDELAHDVLEIAKVMAKKPVKKGELYDLDELWDELVP